MFLNRLKVKLVILLVSFFIVPTILSAWTEGLEAAAEALHNGTATPTQKFFVHEHINEINEMKLSGELPDYIYQSGQGDFWDRNIASLKDAAAKEGLEIHLKKPDRFEAGTDTDAPLTRKTGSNTDITVEKLKKVEKRYKNNMKKNYTDAGLKAPEKLADTNTDILVDPDASSEFQECAAHVNNNGGTAYTNPDAVRAEIKIGKNEPISIKEASAYTEEVGRLANEKASKARDLRHKAQATQNYDPAKAKKLRAQAQLNDSQASKYINRSDKAANNLRRQHSLDDLPIDTKSSLDKAIRKIDKKTGLGRGVATKSDAVFVGNLQKHASEKASQRFIDTLADIAKKSPNVANDAQKAIAKSLNKMSPSAQGRAIEALEKKVGKSFAKRVVKNAKALRKTVLEIRAAKKLKRIYKAKPPGPMHYAMLGVGAYFMGKDGVYHALKKVKANTTYTEFVANVFAESVYHGSGFGYAWEEAVAEMKLDYQKQLTSGKPPSISRDIGVTVVKTGFYMGRDLVVMAVLLPDMLYELITGEKDAQRREDYSKQFLAAVQEKMRNKKMLEDAKMQAKKDGIYSEDLIKYFHCLCSKGCTMMMGGNYNPNFDGDGHGNCKCCGTYNCFKTPMAGNIGDKNGCFNAITQMHYAKNKVIFDQWNKAAIANNADSIKKEVEAIENNISNGTIMEIVDLFQDIEPLLLKKTSLASDIRGRIYSGLRKQAAEHISDVRMDKPLHTAVKKIQKAVDLYKGRGGSDQNRREDLEKILTKYTMWEKNWNEFVTKTAPEIEKLLYDGQIYTAQEKLQAIHSRRRKDLPDRYRSNKKDPIFVMLDKLQDQKSTEHTDQYRKFANKITYWKDRRDPKGALKEFQEFYEKWEINPMFVDSHNRTLHDLKQAARMAKEAAKKGAELENDGNFQAAVVAYRGSLKIQNDTAVQKNLDSLLAKMSLSKQLLSKGRQEWVSGYLTKAIKNLQIAKDNNPSDKQIAKMLKDTQSQKKRMDDALKKVNKLIGDKKLDQAEDVLAKVGRISSKYLPYTQALKRLDDEKKKLVEEESVTEQPLEKLQPPQKPKTKPVNYPDEKAKGVPSSDAGGGNVSQVPKNISSVEAKYIGCYKEKGHKEKVVPLMKNRVMNGYTFGGNMTVSKCTKVCLGKGFKYAAVQYANQCFCGNSYDVYGIANNCNMSCSGNKNEICGGAWANSVYSLTGNKKERGEDSSTTTVSAQKSAFGNPAGKWLTGGVAMELHQNGDKIYGTYTKSDGKMLGSIQGDSYVGHWIQNSSGMKCKQSFKGSHYWGKQRAIFKDNSFDGAWGYCNDEPDHSWHGERINKITEETEKNTITNIKNPMIDGVALDWCKEWARNCGKPAADAWCKANGYGESVSYIMKKNTPPTRIISTGKVCNKPFCSRIAKIKCKNTNSIVDVNGKIDTTAEKAALIKKIRQIREKVEAEAARRAAEKQRIREEAEQEELAMEMAKIREEAERAEEEAHAVKIIKGENSSKDSDETNANSDILGGYWKLVKRKGSIGRECAPAGRYYDYYRDTISGFGTHITITNMIRKGNEVYCKNEAEWQEPPQKLYPGTMIKFPVTMRRLVDTGKYGGCDLSVSYDPDDLECGGTYGNHIGSVKISRKDPKAIHREITWKVKDAFRKKAGEKLTIRTCFSGGRICGKPGFWSYYEWVPRGNESASSSIKDNANKNLENTAAKKTALAEKIRKIRNEAEKATATITAPANKTEKEEYTSEEGSKNNPTVIQPSYSASDPTGEWSTSEGKMVLQKDGYNIHGTYDQDQGKISGTMKGTILRGYWSENKASVRCKRIYNGRYYWGKIRFRFTKNKFDGAWGYCNDEPSNSWHGKRINN